MRFEAYLLSKTNMAAFIPTMQQLNREVEDCLVQEQLCLDSKQSLLVQRDNIDSKLRFVDGQIKKIKQQLQVVRQSRENCNDSYV